MSRLFFLLPLVAVGLAQYGDEGAEDNSKSTEDCPPGETPAKLPFYPAKPVKPPTYPAVKPPTYPLVKPPIVKLPKYPPVYPQRVKPPVYPSVRPPTYPTVKPSTYPQVKPPTYPPVKPPVKPTVYPLPVKPPVFPPVRPPTYPTVKLPTYPSVKPPVHPPPVRPPLHPSPVTPPTYPTVKPPTYPSIKPPVSPPVKPPTKPPTYPPAPPPTCPTNPPPPVTPTPTPDAQQGVGFAASGNAGYETCIKSNPVVFCQQIAWWDENSRDQPAVLLSPPGYVAYSPYAESLQQSDIATLATDRTQCMDIPCICQFARGSYSNNQCRLPRNQVYAKVMRKELRMMTDDERSRFRNAMWSIRLVQYLALSKIHSSYVTSPAAHSGPAFLPWHREFLKRLEMALRQYDPYVFLPYWDSTLDAALDDPKASVMWSEELMGSTDSNGTLNSGLFAYWQSQLDHRTQRAYGKSSNSRPMAQYALDYIKSQVNTITDALAFTAASKSCPRTNVPPAYAIEYVHGSNHIWIGGDMLVTTKSTNDPLFFLHHCMIDFMWETWRLSKQSRTQRENDYPTDNINCSSQSHFSRSIMVPFSPMVNLDGLSNKYTDNLYSYAPRPTCSSANRNCGSRYLFCHGTQFICISRIRVGFPCDPSRYGGVDPCYGSCVNRVCQAPPRSTFPQLAASAPQEDLHEEPVIPDESCFNQNPCCATWAENGGCQRGIVRMTLICPASCQLCTPRAYKLHDDCMDRHQLCNDFKAAGKCTSNEKFMAENCRRTCGFCAIPRSTGCF